MLEMILNKSARLSATCLMAAAFGLGQPALADALWEGETRHTVGEYPFISKLSVVDPAAPLVVFTPGRSALARIAYGGHEGGLPQDFLAHWVQENGYNFLGISYPILTQSRVFETAYPDFTVRDWGQGSAQVTQDVMAQAGLTGPIIHVGWSMSGRNAQSYAEAAKALGLEQDFFVSLSASPPLPGLLGMNHAVELTEHGLAPFPPGAKPAVRQIGAANKANGREVIPAQAIATEYLGETPIGLMARGLRFDSASKTAVQDHWADMQDTKFYDYDSFPFVGTVLPGQGDPRHALTDVAAWGIYNTNKIYAMAGKAKALRKMNPAKFKALVALTLSTPQDLSVTIGGNHFFFVGEAGAKATAEAIRELDDRVETLRQEVNALTASE